MPTEIQKPKVWVPDGSGEKVIATASTGDLSDDGKKLVLKNRVDWVVQEKDRKGYLLKKCRVQEGGSGTFNKPCKLTDMGPTVIKFDVDVK